MVKRSDLTTEMILRAIDRHGLRAWEALVEDFPAKLVRTALYRENAAGNLDYGVCVERSWMTEQGRRRLVSGRRAA